MSVLVTSSRGGYRIFQKGGLRSAIRNAGPREGGGGGGRGVLFALGPIQKVGGGEGGGGGVLSASGLIRKAGRGEEGCCPALQARYKKRGGGLFSRRGGGTLYERGGCNPQTLTPPPTPGSASELASVLCTILHKFVQ